MCLKPGDGSLYSHHKKELEREFGQGYTFTCRQREGEPTRRLIVKATGKAYSQDTLEAYFAYCLLKLHKSTQSQPAPPPPHHEVQWPMPPPPAQQSGVQWRMPPPPAQQIRVQWSHGQPWNGNCFSGQTAEWQQSKDWPQSAPRDWSSWTQHLPPQPQQHNNVWAPCAQPKQKQHRTEVGQPKGLTMNVVTRKPDDAVLDDDLEPAWIQTVRTNEEAAEAASFNTVCAKAAWSKLPQEPWWRAGNTSNVMKKLD